MQEHKRFNTKLLYFKTQFLHQLHSRMRFLAPARQVELTSMRLDDLDTRLSWTKKSLAKQSNALLEINNRFKSIIKKSLTLSKTEYSICSKPIKLID